MAISVYERQNDKILLKCLVAQRREYSFVKRIKFWKVFISVGLVTVFTILTTIFDNLFLASISTLLNMLILIVSKNIEKYMSSKQVHAAKIQQYFDANCYNSTSGQQLIPLNTLFVSTEIADIVSEVHDDALPSVKNWYSDYSSFFPYKQILFCQKENINWDGRLRNFYKTAIIICSVIIILGTIVYAIVKNISFNSWMTIISFLLVIADYVINTICILNSDTKRLEQLFTAQKKAEQKCDFKSNEYEDLLKLQKLIYEHRQNCFLIPDFIYKMKEKKYQKHEDLIAENLANIEELS